MIHRNEKIIRDLKIGHNFIIFLTVTLTLCNISKFFKNLTQFLNCSITHHGPFQGLAILILLFLTSAHSVPTNCLLWLIALAALSGSIFSQLAYYFPSLLTIRINYVRLATNCTVQNDPSQRRQNSPISSSCHLLF